MYSCRTKVRAFSRLDLPAFTVKPFHAVIAFLVVVSFPELLAQKECSDPPLVVLSASSGSTCFANPVTVEGNTFGGSATLVRITHNGRGNITPSQSSSSPFSFTYSPSVEDTGKTVRIICATDNPLKAPCKAARDTFLLNVTNEQSSPEIDKITNPTCMVSTGTVSIRNLPTGQGWTIRVDPGGWTISGSEAVASVGELSPGSYTFTVSSGHSCFHTTVLTAVIGPQPVTPGTPVPLLITPPACDEPSGVVTFGSLPPEGTWTLTRYPEAVSLVGTGTTAVIEGIPPGTYNFTVTNEAGCVSVFSRDVQVPAGPPALSPPLIGNVVQPTAEIPAGSITLTGLPESGSWIIHLLPGDSLYAGTGQSFTVEDLPDGTYKFQVSGEAGCLSAESEEVTIAAPARPQVVVTDPPPVCEPGTTDLTSPLIIAGSTEGLIFSFWKDAEATVTVENPAAVPAGEYFIKGTSAAGYYDMKPVMATDIRKPVARAGQDQILSLTYTTALTATLEDGETGYWSCDDGSIVFEDNTDPKTMVSGLSDGRNELRWIVSNTYCPADTGMILITVGDPVVPTLITPNGDSKNEYFIIPGLESLGRTELIIYDRKGTMLFRSTDYDNSWNGVDYNESPLPGDTYFYSLKTSRGRAWNGYIIIRR